MKVAVFACFCARKLPMFDEIVCLVFYLHLFLFFAMGAGDLFKIRRFWHFLFCFCVGFEGVCQL